MFYNNIRQIRIHMQRILCRVANCTWYYIKNFMDRQGLKVTAGVKNTQSQTILSWGLCYQSLRQTSQLEVLRLNTHSKMVSFRKLFGDTCGFGIRKKAQGSVTGSWCYVLMMSSTQYTAQLPAEILLKTRTASADNAENNYTSWRSFCNGIGCAGWN